jgi:beta-galactosidase
LYRELYRRNLLVDFARSDADLARYRLAIAPHLYLVSDRAAENIERYVAGGGTLLMNFFSGIVDPNDHVRPGGYPAPFRKLLGLWIEEFAAYAESQANEIKTIDGKMFACDLWSDVIRLEGAEALAHYHRDFVAGLPAVTRHPFGEGVSYYLGTNLDAEGLAWLFDRACADARLASPEHVVANASTSAAPGRLPAVEVTERRGDVGTFLFALNYSDEPVTIELKQPGRELLSGEKVDTTVTLRPRGVAIVT